MCLPLDVHLPSRRPEGDRLQGLILVLFEELILFNHEET